VDICYRLDCFAKLSDNLASSKGRTRALDARNKPLGDRNTWKSWLVEA